MNRNVFILVLAALCCISCLSEMEKLGSPSDPEFTAAISCTKTTVCTDSDSLNAGKISWEPDDIIVLTGSSGIPVRYGIKTINEDGTALFVKKNKEPSVGTGPYTAVYGAESLKNQTYSPIAGRIPMIAQSPNTQLHFTSSCGLLKIHLSHSGTSISQIIVRSDSDSLFYLTCNQPVNISEGADFFIALPEGYYDKFEFIDTDGRACTKQAKEGKKTFITTNTIKSISFVSSLSFIFLQNCFEASVQTDGSLAMDSFSIVVNCKVGNSAYSVIPIDTEPGENSRKFKIEGSDGKVYFTGSFGWTQVSTCDIRGDISIKCERGVSDVELCPKIAIPHSAYPSAGWASGQHSYTLGQSGFFKSFTAKSFDFNLSAGNPISFSYDSECNNVVVNGSSSTGLWYIKYGLAALRTNFQTDDNYSFSFTVSSARNIRLSQFDTYSISQSSSWTSLGNLKDIIPGSALDFSSMGLQDAPAGKYGWLKSTKGGFEFEGKPGVPQKFYGVNLCSSSNFISHELSDSLSTRFASLGYNAVRIHHHDKDIMSGTNWDKLDYLLSKFFEKGIYVTTDLYVSRPVKYSTLGLEGSGNMTKGLFKNLVGCYDPAFNNWCQFTKTFLEHVNPYTGRAYKDEPGIPLISLINEGRLNGCGEKECPPIQQAWHDYGGTGFLSWNTPGFDDFEEYLNTLVFTKCSHFVDSLGAKALLTNDNNGKRHGDMEGNTALYDYVDNHFYIDYPDAIDDNNTVPATITNVNLSHEGGPEMLRREYIKNAQKPYTITEWNYCGPNRYRGMSGMMMGGMAASGGWDGIWRFAYSHAAVDIGYNPDSYPSRVNLASDPLNLASERAAVCLYLRDDFSSNGSIDFDKAAGTMKVVSDRTCGFFIKNGSSSAGPIEATIHSAPASIWISSLSLLPIRESDRLLLIHATDVQGENVKYGNKNRSMLLAWGLGNIIENGSAEITLSLNNISGWKVYELASNGERIREIPSSAANGKLVFTVSTNGPSGGRMYYELIRL